MASLNVREIVLLIQVISNARLNILCRLDDEEQVMLREIAVKLDQDREALNASARTTVVRGSTSKSTDG